MLLVGVVFSWERNFLNFFYIVPSSLKNWEDFIFLSKIGYDSQFYGVGIGPLSKILAAKCAATLFVS